MHYIDFSNRQNRNVRLTDVSDDYLNAIREQAKSDPYYPEYHIAPEHGLLNDPNGLYQDEEGIYHLFYQWFPIGPVHGLKYWYHVSTEDFIYYRDHGCMISPDHPDDHEGCYTGMALKDQGDVHLFYTGIKGDDKIPTTLHAQIKDGELKPKRAIARWDPTVSTLNYRDPFVYERDGSYYMLVGAEDLDHKGIIMLYKGVSPTEFTYVGKLKLMDHHFGYMIECPNYYEEDGRGILIFSPQGIESPNRYDYRNVFSVVYAVGSMINPDTLQYDHDTFYELDKGFDFYAPQVFKDLHGRRILYGWLGNSKSPYPTDGNQWAHMLTIPREVTVEEDRLKQWPLPELHQLREKSIRIEGEQFLQTRSLELRFRVSSTFRITLFNGRGESLTFQSSDGEYILDRSKTTLLYNERYGQVRYSKRLNPEEHEGCLYLDRSSIELFLDGGLTVFTGRFFLEDFDRIEVSGTEGTLYPLSRICVQKE